MFDWFNSLFEAILKLFPRIIVIRATHGGVKWKKGKNVVALKPGVHIYWPLVSDIEIIVTARQTLNLPTQILTTQDNKKVVVSTVVVYRVKNIIQAIGKENWDVDTTINDITLSAIVGIIAQYSLDSLLGMVSDEKLDSLFTLKVRKELRRFGVYVNRCKLTDFADCKVYKLVMDKGSN